MGDLMKTAPHQWPTAGITKKQLDYQIDKMIVKYDRANRRIVTLQNKVESLMVVTLQLKDNISQHDSVLAFGIKALEQRSEEE